MRAPPNASAWSRISPYLDRALELEPHDRDNWLTSLTVTDPEIAREVRAMLAELASLNARGFLARQPIGVAGAPSWAGTRVGAYTIEERIGRGGMGEVWLARRSDGRFEGCAAVKLLDAALLGRPAEQRFVREGSVLAKLRHPHIAQLIDAGIAPSGQPYLVLEYIEGQRIDHYADQHHLDVEARLRLFIDVLAAVAHAHSHLVVHRDLKPSNILVSPEGVVKLLDFGVAALIGPAVAELTRESDPALTPGYAAPEQLLGQPVTTAADVYALGVVLFVLLTGKHPFSSGNETSLELARLTLDQPAPRPSEAADDPRRVRALRGDLDNIIAKALEKDPAERYVTAAALAQDLERFLRSEPVSARPGSLAYRTSRFIRRHRSAAATGALVLLLLIGATVATTMQMLEARRQRDAALYEFRRAEFQARFAYQIMSEVGDGGPITIQNLLEKGIEVLERNYGDDPRFVIGMLVNISGRYMDIDDTAGELAALVKAEQIARRLGDPDFIAFVQCNTVETELAAGRPDRAAARLRDGLEHLARVPKPGSQRLRECGLAEARLRWAEGNFEDGIAAAMRVANGMEARGETSEINYVTVTSTLEMMLGEAGRRREALDWNHRSSVANERAGRSGTMSQHWTRHNEASHRYELGEPRAALGIQRSIVQRVAAQQGENAVPPTMAGRLGLYQVRVEETGAGLELLDRGVAGTSAHPGPSHVRALLDRATANLWLGKLDAALEDLTEAERLSGQNPTNVHDRARAARLLRAQWHFARGEPAASLREIDGLLQEIGYPTVRVTNRLSMILTLKARAELALGATDAALETAENAVAIAETMSLDAQRSALVGAALMALAETQRARGDAANAAATAQRAAQALTAALGPEHSETQGALRFR